MALGDTYNNNNTKKNYSPSVTSGYRFSHPESTIDKTQLSFSYWNKLLKISISPKKNTENGEIAFDHENAGDIYLTHSRAYILHNEILKFIEEYKQNTTVGNKGINTSKDALIYISDGKEFNAESPCLVIRKIDENGHSTSVYVYEFRVNLYKSIVNYNESTTEFDVCNYDLLEIQLVATLLKEYYEAMTMATAYSFKEANKYDDSRIGTKLKVIAEKLGVEYKSNKTESTQTRNVSYFNKPATTSQPEPNYSNNSYEVGSFDDL